MKKTALTLLLISMIATSGYAINVLDNILCRRDVLRSNNKPILVNRLTDEVKYVWRDDGQWIELTGKSQEQYQSMYNAQVGLRAPAQGKVINTQN